MLIGYGWVPTAEDSATVTSALRAAGVAADRIHLDVGEARGDRPRLGEVLGLLRAGETLVVTRLGQLGMSVLQVVKLGAALHRNGVGLRVLEQGIDTATPEGRAMVGMLSVLADHHRELVSGNTRAGLAVGRARGRKGGRRPSLTAEQVGEAQRLYDAGEHTGQQIADLLGVKRSTLYGHLDRPTTSSGQRGGTPAPASSPTSLLSAPKVQPFARPHHGRVDRPIADLGEHQGAWPARAADRGGAVRCPSCGCEPDNLGDRMLMLEDQCTTWLYADPTTASGLAEQLHCAQCQPHSDFELVSCRRCGDGPILAGPLAALGSGLRPPPIVRDWLHRAGWRENAEGGLVCGSHPVGSCDPYAQVDVAAIEQHRNAGRTQPARAATAASDLVPDQKRRTTRR